MFSLISSDGLKMPLVFIKSGQKVNINEYIQTLENHVKPWIDPHFSLDNNVVFQQDGAPQHTSQKTWRWLQENLSKHWSKELWLPRSLDLSPFDYSIWTYVGSKACQCPHNSVNSLKASIKKEWDKIPKDYIQTTCSRFRSQLEAVIDAEGGHIE